MTLERFLAYSGIAFWASVVTSGLLLALSWRKAKPEPPKPIIATPDEEADVNDYKVPEGFMRGREHVAYRVEADSDREAAHKFWEWYCT